MNDEPLTPTHSKSHAPAKKLLQAKASLKDLFSSPDDIRLLNTNDYSAFPYRRSLDCAGWAISATQKNSNQDRFLSGLAIREWNVENLLHLIQTPMWSWWSEPETVVQEWLRNKSDEWLQRFYALLYRDVKFAHAQMREYFMIRCERENTYLRSDDCFFSNNSSESGIDYDFVAKGTYTSGDNPEQQEESRRFLENLVVSHPESKGYLARKLRRGWRCHLFGDRHAAHQVSSHVDGG